MLDDHIDAMLDAMEDRYPIMLATPAMTVLLLGCAIGEMFLLVLGIVLAPVILVREAVSLLGRKE